MPDHSQDYSRSNECNCLKVPTGDEWGVSCVIDDGMGLSVDILTATVKRGYTGEDLNILPCNGPLTTTHNELLVQVFLRPIKA